MSFPSRRAAREPEQMAVADLGPARESRPRPCQPAKLARIEALLTKYPALSAEEEREIARYLRNPPLLDIEFLRQNEALRGNLGCFEQEHREAISPRPAGLVSSVTGALVLLVGLAAFLAA